jgi:hypothetical protein
MHQVMNAYIHLDVDQINYMQELIGTRGLVTVGCSILKLAHNAKFKKYVVYCTHTCMHTT